MDNIARHLDEGVLPIYHSELTDDDVRYHSVSFVSLEKVGVERRQRAGTHFLISDSRSGGRVFTETQQKQLADIQAAIPPADEEAVLYIRTEIENEGAVPRYAWIKAPARQCPPTICISERLINSTGKRIFIFSEGPGILYFHNQRETAV